MPTVGLAFCGSLRGLSSTSALAHAAAASSASVLIAAKLDTLPLYDGDVEAAGLPPSVATLRKRAFQASAFLFSTPEYNGFTSAALKNAIDWLSRSGAEGVSPLKGKPFAVISAGGGSGGMRAQRNICAIGSDFKMKLVGEDNPIAVKLWDGIKRFDEKTGELVDADTKAALAALVVQLETAGKQYTAEVAATKA